MIADVGARFDVATLPRQVLRIVDVHRTRVGEETRVVLVVDAELQRRAVAVRQAVLPIAAAQRHVAAQLGHGILRARGTATDQRDDHGDP